MTATKPFLQFSIPTWNRQREVEVCVRSIASQIAAQVRSVTILVQDDCSTDGTKASIEALQREFPGLIEYRCTEKRIDYSVAFKTLFEASEAEWVWTFGDDDMLLEGALARMLPVLTETDCEMIHCVEKGREAGSGKMARGKLLAMCNMFGWLDMTGFITCNVVRSERLKQAAASPRWPRYAKSAFVQSCALLEVLHDSEVGLMDIPLVSTQNETQTQEAIDRWTADKIGERYMLMADCVELMFDDGILTNKVKRAFFRYQNYHLWDRHITYFINDYLTQGMIRPHDQWASQSKLLRFIDDDEFAAGVTQNIETVRGLLTLHGYLSANLESIKGELGALSDLHSTSLYPWGYLVPRELPNTPSRFAKS